MAFWDTPSSVSVKLPFRWRISFGEKLNGLEWLAIKVKKPSYKIESSQVKYLKTHTFNFPKTLIWQPIQLTMVDARLLNPDKTKNNNKDLYGNSATDVNLAIYPSSKINSSEFKINYNRETGNARAIPDNQTTYKTLPFSTQTYFVKFLEQAGYYNPEEYDREDALYRFRSVPFKQDLAGALVGTNKDYIDYYASDRDGTQNVSSTKTFYTLNIEELDPEGYPVEIWQVHNPLVTSVAFGDLDYGDDKPLTVTVDISYDWAKLNTKAEFEATPEKINREKNK
jgi:hypothetical protein